jgi:hypothetical protein
VRFQRLVEVVDQVRVHVVVEVLHPYELLDLRDTGLRRSDLALLLVHLVVLARFEARHDGGEAVIGVGSAFGHAGDY